MTTGWCRRARRSRESARRRTGWKGPESLQGAWNLRDEQIAKIYERYLVALRECNALDFDDLLLKTVELFEKSELVRERYSRKFKYVMVDEYQDTNRPQYLLIRRLAGFHRNLAIVGDPDQSIYKWRGADLRNLVDFEADFGDAKVVRLEQNYRSTQVILDAATAVIQQNRNRKDKRLWTDRKGGEKIVYYRGSDELEEADFIAKSIKRLRAEDIDTMMAILYRTNAQSRAIEDQLMRENIPYKIIGGVRFYERKEIKDALAYLKLIINPHDDVSLRRVINVPARGVGKGVMDSLQAIDPDRIAADAPPLLAAGLAEVSSARSLWARLVYAVDQGKLGNRAVSSLRTFRDLIVGLADHARTDSVSITIGKMLDRSGYLNDLRDENSEEANERIENLMELVSASRDYEGRDPEASIGGYVDRLSLLSEVDEESGTRNAKVWLMSMHAAKGLEFPVVFIAGMEDGLFPHSRSAESADELEEERRLFYVGMTRAEQRLFLTGAARRRVFGRTRQRNRRVLSTKCRRSCSSGSRPCSRQPIRGTSLTRTTSSGPTPTRAAAKGKAQSSGKTRRATPTRTRISPRPEACGPACASSTRSSASAPCSRSKSTPTTSRSRCGSIPSGRRSCWRNSRNWNRRRGGSRAARPPDGNGRKRSRYSGKSAPHEAPLHRQCIDLRPARQSSFSASFATRHDIVAFFHLDQADALRGAADESDVARLHAQDHPLLRDQRRLVVVVDVGDADDLAVAVQGVDVDDADAAA